MRRWRCTLPPPIANLVRQPAPNPSSAISSDAPPRAPRPETKDARTATHPQLTASRRERSAQRDPASQQRAVGVTVPDPATNLRAALTLALETRRFDAAEEHAESLLAQDQGRAGV